MLKNLFNRFRPPPASVAAAPLAAPVDIAGADALIVQGDEFEEAGELAAAEALYRQAVALAPGHARAHLNLGIVLGARGQEGAAIAAFEQVLSIDASHVFGNYNLARLMVLRGDTARARVLVNAALRARPSFPQALELLVRIERDEGFAEETLGLLRTIVEREPGNWIHRSFELMLMNFVEGVQAEDLYRRSVELGTTLEQAVPVRFEHRGGRADPARRLRVGYLSADFVGHPVAFFLAPVIEGHNRAQVDVFCYSLVVQADAVTTRIRSACDHWRDVATLDDEGIADAIASDGIDVLVDLMGHSSIPRLGVLCQRPAPVQVGWLGYLNTTGLTRVDFRISDARSDPPAVAQALHTERLVALPDSQWCYPGNPAHAFDAVPPCERNGHVTFGSFSAALKITPGTCRRWAQVLLRLPGSRLVIGDITAERKRAALREIFAGEGVAAERIEFRPRVETGEYMALYNGVDITFDPYPYGGGTTTFDSLWMGVPVAATIGHTPVSRSAASILAVLGLEEWIAASAGDFVEMAVARATDREALRVLRACLRARMQASALTDMPRFVGALESAYRRMWIEKTA
jgi:protein O-GlcNAc transferase